ncbi:Aldo/keto reductase [Byssothecium circinans]|uniref:Aldo/keto reductase n=1 Tax=Byssothecium circinans TaxID=147558 RepID=A0A6A5THY2_9PLEO|nr:Aldo/keto reductase [Byssothecium circinans]
MAPITNLDIIFGAMTFGKEADLNWQSRGLSIHTKLFPNVASILGRRPTHLDAAGLRGGLEIVPIEETLKAVNDLCKEGKFKKWGVSNYMAWEVATICEISDKQGYSRPSVYQGVYNALFRTVEHELLPCLRKYGMAFYAYNPLAGGYLTDRRFDENRMRGKMYRARYWNDAFFNAFEVVRPVVKKVGLRESEAALRWVVWHGVLKWEFADKIIIGASSKKQLEMNLKDLEGSELPDEVLTAFDSGYEKCRVVTWAYFH